MQQLDWCIGYLAGCQKGRVARILGANRSHIRRQYLRDGWAFDYTRHASYAGPLADALASVPELHDLLARPDRYLERAPVVRAVQPVRPGVVQAIATRDIGLAVVALRVRWMRQVGLLIEDGAQPAFAMTAAIHSQLATVIMMFVFGAAAFALNMPRDCTRPIAIDPVLTRGWDEWPAVPSRHTPGLGYQRRVAMVVPKNRSGGNWITVST